MRVRLLGTGSADGWPNVFCECASCAVERLAGRSRAATSAVIDDAILVDFGPSTAIAARRAGISFAAIEHVLITHGHADHLAPEFLLWRSWVEALPTMHLWGPAAALANCRDWVHPDAPVDFHVVAPGDVLTLHTHAGDVVVRALASAHGHGNGDIHADEALIYDITGSDGDRLLYATDTGPLPGPTLRALRDRAFALVLIEETFGAVADHGTGHHDLHTLPTTLQHLREIGAITDRTDVVAFHLSHHNPPMPELSVALAAMGARIVDDGTVLDTHADARIRHLVTGGARSGKSHHAEALVSDGRPVTYVATGGTRPEDSEWQARVQAHQSRRPSAWTTIETTDIASALRNAEPHRWVLVDCLTLWLTAVLDEAEAWSGDLDAHERAGEHVDTATAELIDAIAKSPAHIVFVTNEVGMDLVPDTASGRLFRDLLGVLNTRIAAACSDVTLVVAGRPLPLPRRTP